MIDNTRRYVAPILRSWVFLSQNRFWLKRKSEPIATTRNEPSLSLCLPAAQERLTPDKQSRWLDPLDRQPPEVHLRSLLALCQGLTHQYQSTPEVALERWWWGSLHRAGVRLRDTLEGMRAYQDSLDLTRQELERAYFVLIHVAYFFEPGGIAEAICREQGWIADEQDFERL